MYYDSWCGWRLCSWMLLELTWVDFHWCRVEIDVSKLTHLRSLMTLQLCSDASRHFSISPSSHLTNLGQLVSLTSLVCHFVSFILQCCSYGSMMSTNFLPTVISVLQSMPKNYHHPPPRALANNSSTVEDNFCYILFDCWTLILTCIHQVFLF